MFKNTFGKHIVAILLVIGLALSLTIPTFATDDVHVSIISTQKLSANKASYKVLNEVVVQELSDGSVRTIIKGSSPGGEKPHSYKIKVDLETGTYTTIEQPVDDPPKSARLSNTEYSRGVKVITDDPVGVNVCSTRANLVFESDGDYPYYISGGKEVWAEDLSIFLTTWFIDSSLTYAIDGYDPARYVGQVATGYFSNYDFGDDDEWTWVDHRVELKGYNQGRIDYTITTNHAGEGSLLLDDDVVVY